MYLLDCPMRVRFGTMSMWSLLLSIVCLLSSEAQAASVLDTDEEVSNPNLDARDVGILLTSGSFTYSRVNTGEEFFISVDIVVGGNMHIKKSRVVASMEGAQQTIVLNETLLFADIFQGSSMKLSLFVRSPLTFDHNLCSSSFYSIDHLWYGRVPELFKLNMYPYATKPDDETQICGSFAGSINWHTMQPVGISPPTLTHIKGDSVRVIFGSPLYDGGEDIDFLLLSVSFFHYDTINQYPHLGRVISSSSVTIPISPNSTTGLMPRSFLLTHDDLRPSTQVTVRIAFRNKAHLLSKPSDASTGMTLPLPLQPTSLVLRDITTFSMTLSWEPMQVNIDNPAWEHYLRPDTHTISITCVTELRQVYFETHLFQAVNNTHHFSGLISNAEYFFQVQAVSSVGKSEMSIAVTAYTLPAPPPLPANVTVVPNLNGLLVSWTFAPYAYDIFIYSTHIDIPWSREFSASSNLPGSYYQVGNSSATALHPNTMYKVRVCFLAGTEYRTCSLQVTATTLGTVPVFHWDSITLSTISVDAVDAKTRRILWTLPEKYVACDFVFSPVVNMTSLLTNTPIYNFDVYPSVRSPWLFGKLQSLTGYSVGITSVLDPVCGQVTFLPVYFETGGPMFNWDTLEYRVIQPDSPEAIRVRVQDWTGPALDPDGTQVLNLPYTDCGGCMQLRVQGYQIANFFGYLMLVENHFTAKGFVGSTDKNLDGFVISGNGTVLQFDVPALFGKRFILHLWSDVWEFDCPIQIHPPPPEFRPFSLRRKTEDARVILQSQRSALPANPFSNLGELVLLDGWNFDNQRLFVSLVDRSNRTSVCALPQVVRANVTEAGSGSDVDLLMLQTLSCFTPRWMGRDLIFRVVVVDQTVDSTDSYNYPTTPVVHFVVGCESGIHPAMTYNCDIAGGSTIYIKTESLVGVPTLVSVGGNVCGDVSVVTGDTLLRLQNSLQLPSGLQKEDTLVKCINPPGVGESIDVQVCVLSLCSDPVPLLSYAPPTITRVRVHGSSGSYYSHVIASGPATFYLPRGDSYAFVFYGEHFGTTMPTIVVGGRECEEPRMDRSSPWTSFVECHITTNKTTIHHPSYMPAHPSGLVSIFQQNGRLTYVANFTVSAPPCTNTVTLDDGCGECPPGSYYDDSGPCLLCHRGYFSSDWGMTSCESCPPGRSSDEGSVVCHPCPAGTHNPNWREVCTECQPGRYAEEPNSLHCNFCPIGTFSANLKSMKCTNCSEHTFAGGEGFAECRACPAGKGSPAGSSFCFDCPAGTFGTTKLFGDRCEVCAAGKYSVVGSKDCLSCPRGRHSNSTRASTCLECEAGKSAGNLERVECSSCEINTFQSQKGTSACLACDAGKYTDDLMSTSCKSCQPGRMRSENDKKCKPCEAGTHQPEEGQSFCLSCLAGRFSEEGQMDCEACPANSFSGSAGNTFSDCRQCPAGQWSHPGAETCLPCKKSQVSFPGGDCQACPLGSTTIPPYTECINCESGRYAAPGLLNETFCYETPAGYYNPFPAQTAPMPCPPGHLSTKPNAKSCDPCALGKVAPTLEDIKAYNAMIKENLKADRTLACVDCPTGKFSSDITLESCQVCPAGKYQFQTGQSSCLDCMAGTTTFGNAVSCSEELGFNEQQTASLFAVLYFTLLWLVVQALFIGFCRHYKIIFVSSPGLMLLQIFGLLVMAIGCIFLATPFECSSAVVLINEGITFTMIGVFIKMWRIYQLSITHRDDDSSKHRLPEDVRIRFALRQTLLLGVLPLAIDAVIVGAFYVDSPIHIKYSLDHATAAATTIAGWDLTWHKESAKGVCYFSPRASIPFFAMCFSKILQLMFGLWICQQSKNVKSIYNEYKIIGIAINNALIASLCGVITLAVLHDMHANIRISFCIFLVTYFILTSSIILYADKWWGVLKERKARRAILQALEEGGGTFGNQNMKDNLLKESLLQQDRAADFSPSSMEAFFSTLSQGPFTKIEGNGWKSKREQKRWLLEQQITAQLDGLRKQLDATHAETAQTKRNLVSDIALAQVRQESVKQQSETLIALAAKMYSVRKDLEYYELLARNNGLNIDELGDLDIENEVAMDRFYEESRKHAKSTSHSIVSSMGDSIDKFRKRVSTWTRSASRSHSQVGPEGMEMQVRTSTSSASGNNHSLDHSSRSYRRGSNTLHLPSSSGADFFSNLKVPTVVQEAGESPFS